MLTNSEIGDLALDAAIMPLRPGFSQETAVKVALRAAVESSRRLALHVIGRRAANLVNMVVKPRVRYVIGSRQMAAGFTVFDRDGVLCITDSLAFFDNPSIQWDGAKRVLLLAGNSATAAEECCRSYGVEYRAAYGSEDLYNGITWLVQSDSDQALLLEVVSRR